MGFMPKDSDFQVVRTSMPIEANDLIRSPSENEYQINGGDAFVDFALSSKVTQSDAQYLRLELTCSDGSSSVPMQLFWLEDGKLSYDEEHSARFSYRPGQQAIDLRTIPKWSSTAAISRVRVDIDPINSCAHFNLNNPSFGLKGAKL
jgi:hypothetical protein